MKQVSNKFHHFASLCVYLSVAFPLRTCLAKEANYIQVRPECRNTSDGFPCLTLNDFLPSIESNTTMILEQGIHTIESYFWVTNKTDLTLIGNPTDPSSVVIECNDSYGMIFMDVQQITFSGLTVRHCSFKEIEDIKNTFSYIHSYIILFYNVSSGFSTGILMANISDLRVENAVIDQNEGFGIVGINIVGNSKIVDANFTRNGPRECASILTDSTESGRAGGGMLLLYQDYNDITYLEQSVNNLIVQNMLIEDNTNCLTNQLAAQYELLRNLQINLLSGADGVSIALAQSNFMMNITITNSTFRKNTGFYHGSAMEVAHFAISSDNQVFITNTEFEHNGDFRGAVKDSFVVSPTGALVAALNLPVPQPYFNVELVTKIITRSMSSVKVSNCSFRENIAYSGSGIQVFSSEQTLYRGIQDQIVIQDCLFEKNIGEHGSAISIMEITNDIFEPHLRVTLDSITAIRNQQISTSPIASFQSNKAGVLDIHSTSVNLTGNNLFASNAETAIFVKKGTLALTGTTNFTSNEGVYGGAISLHSSRMVLTGDKADLWFINNRALKRGGGIYVNFENERREEDCFLFFDTFDTLCNNSETCTQSGVYEQFSLNFVNNSALLGTAIFGSIFSTCPWANGTTAFQGLIFNASHSITSAYFSTLSIFFEPPFIKSSSGTTINTDAQDIIANQEASQYLDKNDTIHVFPGQKFELQLSALDKLQQSVPLTVFSQLDTELGSQAYSTITKSNRFLIVGGEEYFTHVPFRVFAEQNTSYNMIITSNRANKKFKVKVLLKDCPYGFNFNVSSQACECNLTLDQVECNSNGTITHRPGYWVGMDEQGNYLQIRCIFNFCNSQVKVFYLSEPDLQCTDNRVGVMCGRCREGFSRMIGTFACDECNSYLNLLFILLFALLGILLFAYFTVFNVTIKDGILNAFIFHANITYVYLLSLDFTLFEAEFFVNLRLNIPICFYPGMTELHLAILRFAFPVYLMILLLVIILCGRYISNHMVSKIFQKINASQIFATVFFMSYLSSVITCMANLSAISSNPVRWILNPNVLYFDSLHIFAVCLSIVFLVIFLPFPLLLLFPRVIFRTPILRKFKPVIDVFIGPLAPKREYWVGLRMVFGLEFVIVTIFLGSYKIIRLVLTIHIILLTLLEVRVQPFNTTTNNFVNNIVMVNLSLFSLSARSADIEIVKQFTAINLYLFVVMVILLNIYYFYNFLLRFKSFEHLHQKVVKYFKKRLRIISQKKNNEGRSHKTLPSNTRTHTTADVQLLVNNNTFEETDFIPFREGLLDTQSNTSY